MSHPDRILTAAETDRVTAADALEAHQRTCKTPGQDAACLSLAWYLERAEKQIALLTVPDVVEETLF
jgi:hypothetical protein